MAIKKPTNVNCVMAFMGKINDFLVHKIYPKRKMAANNILYQTNDASLMDISSPKTAVNPQIKTIKWSCK